VAAFLCVEHGNLQVMPGKRRYGAVIKPQSVAKKIEKDNKYRFLLFVI
jgi:hypothetical protein